MLIFLGFWKFCKICFDYIQTFPQIPPNPGTYPLKFVPLKKCIKSNSCCTYAHDYVVIYRNIVHLPGTTALKTLSTSSCHLPIAPLILTTSPPVLGFCLAWVCLDLVHVVATYLHICNCSIVSKTQWFHDFNAAIHPLWIL